jgi:hypothetical protein
MATEVSGNSKNRWLTYILFNDGSLQCGVEPEDSLVHLAALTRLQA